MSEGELIPLDGFDLKLCSCCVKAFREERQFNFGDLEEREGRLYLTQSHVRWLTCVACGVRVEGKGRGYCPRCKRKRHREQM